MKLTAFKCKNNLTKILSYRSTFKNEFDPSSNLLLLEYIPSGKSNCGLRNQQLTLCAHLQILFVDKQQFSGRFWGISLGLLVTSSPKLLHFDQISEQLHLVCYRFLQPDNNKIKICFACCRFPLLTDYINIFLCQIRKFIGLFHLLTSLFIGKHHVDDHLV